MNVLRDPQKYMAVIDPDSRALHRWNLLITALVLYLAVFVPFQLGFSSDAGTSDEDIYQQTISWIVEISFILDIVLTFFTGYYHSIGDKIMHLPAIRSRYLRGWFVIDLAARLVLFDHLSNPDAHCCLTSRSLPAAARFFPAAMLEAVTGRGNPLLMLKTLVITHSFVFTNFYHVLDIFLFNTPQRLPSKMMRLSKMTHMKPDDDADEGLASIVNPSIIRLLKLILVFVFVVHFAACCLGFMVLHEESIRHDNSASGISSLLKSDDDPEDFLLEWRNWEAGQQYTRALVWCICALMGDVGLFGSPVTPAHVGICLIFIIAGLLWISVVTGSAASLLANMDTSASAQKDKLDGIKTFLTFKKVCEPATCPQLPRSYAASCVDRCRES
jgi:hypothetical protein